MISMQRQFHNQVKFSLNINQILQKLKSKQYPVQDHIAFVSGEEVDIILAQKGNLIN